MKAHDEHIREDKPLWVEPARLIPIEHTGFFPERNAHSELEALYAEEWERRCQPHAGLNYGNGTLQDLMIGVDRRGRATLHAAIDQRDARIAATLIQWLGSPIGSAFVERVLNRAGQHVVIRRTWDDLVSAKRTDSAWKALLEQAEAELAASREQYAQQEAALVEARRTVSTLERVIQGMDASADARDAEITRLKSKLAAFGALPARRQRRLETAE